MEVEKYFIGSYYKNMRKFSIINPKLNKTFYYVKNYFNFIELKKDSKYEFLINQEKKFIQLILDAHSNECLSVWVNFIYWIKTIIPKDSFRLFMLLDIFTQASQDNQIFFKEEESNLIWLEYADLCFDEVEIYNYMLTKGMLTNHCNVIDRIVNYYCGLEDFEKAEKLIWSLCTHKMDNNNIKSNLYEKLKEIIENKINESLASSIIFPEVINKFLYRNNLSIFKSPTINNKNKLPLLKVENKENLNIININVNPNLQLVEISSKEKTNELKQTINFLIKKYSYIKDFLLKYDEQYKQHEDSVLSPTPKPFSFLNQNRLMPRLCRYLIINTLSYMNISDYYINAIKSYNSDIVDFALKQISYLPRKANLEFSAEILEKDCVEYMFKLNMLVYTKYDRDNYSTKISMMKFVNNNYHVRAMTINYSVKNMVYLHGVSEYYLGLFTPFYFIILDTKTMNLVYRHRFDINHYTEENAVIYLFDYNPKIIAFSILNVIYITQIDNRQTVSNKHKFEGHKDEIIKLSYKFIEGINLLISCSKSQIVLWDLDTQNVHKVFSIDETKLLIKGIILINLKVMCITTVYNQLYVLQFADSNIIEDIKVTNFEDDEFVFDVHCEVSNLKDYVYKLNNKNLLLYDPMNEKNIINFFESDQNFQNSDLIFIFKNQIIKRSFKKSNVLVYSFS